MKIFHVFLTSSNQVEGHLMKNFQKKIPPFCRCTCSLYIGTKKLLAPTLATLLRDVKKNYHLCFSASGLACMCLCTHLKPTYVTVSLPNSNKLSAYWARVNTARTCEQIWKLKQQRNRTPPSQTPILKSFYIWDWNLQNCYKFKRWKYFFSSFSTSSYSSKRILNKLLSKL